MDLITRLMYRFGILHSFFPWGGGGKKTIYIGDIGHSQRFRSGSSTYISWTPAADVNRVLWCARFSFKRGKFGVQQYILSAGTDASGYNQTNIGFNSSDQFFFSQYTTSNTTADFNMFSNKVFRDVSWDDVSVIYDSANATAAQRIRVFIKDEEITSWATATYPAQNQQTIIGSTLQHNIGRHGSGMSYYDGLLARVCLIFGQKYTATSYGYRNSNINEWVINSQSTIKALAEAGTAGSRMYDFDNGTSLTTLGYDKSSYGNNATLNNFSLTGATNDWLLDVPGNSYATLNPLRPVSAGGVFSDGNLKGTSENANQKGLCSSLVLNRASIWYAEVTPGGSGTNWFGVTDANIVANDVNTAGQNSVLYYAANGNKYVNGAVTSYGVSYTTEVIGILFNGPANTVTFFKGTASQGVITLPSSTVDYVFCQGNAGGGGATATWDFGQQGFVNKATNAPTAKALCQANLPAIPDATLNPLKHAAVATWTGNSTYPRNVVTGLLFQPDEAEIKCRNVGTTNHVWQSSVVGAGTGKAIYSDQTYAPGNQDAYGYVSAFNSDGIEVNRTGSAGGNVNANTYTYVGKFLKAGGAAVTNNAGSITSQVSANTVAGCSIVRVNSGTGAVGTIGHGLPVPPRLIIAHKISNAGTLSRNWPVWCKPVVDAYGATECLFLNQAVSHATQPNIWTSTAPTSTVFSVGSDTEVNEAGYTYIFYCFCDNRDLPGGIFRIGSYASNASTDGPYIDCGGKVQWLMAQNAAGGSSWEIASAATSTYNPTTSALFANTYGAEQVAGDYSHLFDFVGQGFKVRSTSTVSNTGTPIYLAIIGTHGKYSLGR